MDLTMYLIWSCALFAAYFVKGLAGFGNTPIHTGIMAFFKSNAQLSPVDYLLTLPANGLQLYRYRRSLRREVWLPAALITVASLIPGTILLKQADSRMLKVFFGAVIFLIGLDMFFPRSKDRPALRRGTAVVLTVISGLISGMFGIGLLFAAVMGRTLKDSRALKANLSAVFVADNIARGIMYLVTGLLTREAALQALSLVPAMALGLLAGFKSAGRLEENTVRRCTAVLLSVCGVLLAAGNL